MAVVFNRVGGGGGVHPSVLFTNAALTSSSVVTMVGEGKTYTSIWSGTGCLISNIKKFGSYTYTVTEGARTATGIILVDTTELITVVVELGLPSTYQAVEYIYTNSKKAWTTLDWSFGIDVFRPGFYLEYMELSESFTSSGLSRTFNNQGTSVTLQFVRTYVGTSSSYFDCAFGYTDTSQGITAVEFENLSDSKHYNKKTIAAMDATTGMCSLTFSDGTVNSKSMGVFTLGPCTEAYLTRFPGWGTTAGNTEIPDMRIYKFRVYENGSLFRNYIPCYRKSDNVVGLYDTVLGSFYYSSTNYAFTKGGDI